MAQYRCIVKCYRDRKIHKQGHVYDFSTDPGKHFVPVDAAEAKAAEEAAEPKKKHLGMKDIKA